MQRRPGRVPLELQSFQVDHTRVHRVRVRIRPLRQQTLPVLLVWEVISPAWSFWRWVLCPGDLMGLE